MIFSANILHSHQYIQKAYQCTKNYNLHSSNNFYNIKLNNNAFFIEKIFAFFLCTFNVQQTP